MDVMPMERAVQLREELYQEACADIGSLRSLVKRYEANPLFPATSMPAQARKRQPPPGETTGMQDQLDYLRALVAEAGQLADMVARLGGNININNNNSTTTTTTTSGGEGDIAKALEFARCAVRLTEAHVDWELAVFANEANAKEAKEIVASAGRRTSAVLARGELECLAAEAKLWDEGFPAVRAAWGDLAAREVRLGR